MEKDLRACITVILKSNCDYKLKIKQERKQLRSCFYIFQAKIDKFNLYICISAIFFVTLQIKYEYYRDENFYSGAKYARIAYP